MTGKPGNGSRNRLDNSGNPKSSKAGNLGANSVDSEMGERIDLTIDSGCAACALPVGVASAVWMQKCNRAPQEYIAANLEKFRELGFKTPIRHSNFRMAQYHGQVAQTTGGGVQSGRL